MSGFIQLNPSAQGVSSPSLQECEQLQEAQKNLTQRLDNHIQYTEAKEEKEQADSEAFALIQFIASKAKDAVKDPSTPPHTLEDLLDDIMAVAGERIVPEYNESTDTSLSSQQSIPLVEVKRADLA